MPRVEKSIPQYAADVGCTKERVYFQLKHYGIENLKHVVDVKTVGKQRILICLMKKYSPRRKHQE